jgi:hypothetical protein
MINDNKDIEKSLDRENQLKNDILFLNIIGSFIDDLNKEIDVICEIFDQEIFILAEILP